MSSVVLPDEPLPVRLMNTIWADRLGVHDAISTTDDLGTWLDAVHPGRAKPASDPEDLNRFRALRDALRDLAALRVGDTRTAAVSATTDVQRAVTVVNVAAVLAPLWPRLTCDDGDLRLATDDVNTTRWLLTSIAQQAIDLLTGDGRTPLRACNAPGCVLYFVKDHARREWCSTACGNRVRAARHYHRHRKAPQTP